MDEPPEADTTLETSPADASAADSPTADSPAIEKTSAEYLGRWNRLVSTTNWEKGRIICQWREALVESDAVSSSYTDEAWSRRVGNVSPQHTGRLRRVHQRFAETYENYAGLFWSHFQAALDWNDAEMYLEGAVQNGWSVATMRGQRWEAMGAPDDLKPRPEDVVTAELDEDVRPADEETFSADGQTPPPSISESVGEVRDSDATPDDSGELPPFDVGPGASSQDGLPSDTPAVDPVRPFEDLPPLPPDLNEAFEAFKLAVLGHKLSNWQDVSESDVLSAVEALRQLVLAPPGD